MIRIFPKSQLSKRFLLKSLRYQSDVIVSGLGVVRENEADDIAVLVANYTSPALARSLREKEMTLQTAQKLLSAGEMSQLVALLAPYSREAVERKRTKRHSLDIAENPKSGTAFDLLIFYTILTSVFIKDLDGRSLLLYSDIYIECHGSCQNRLVNELV